ncbi:hypothetical protein E4U41_001988 [Claviceps citrina]|nr:hypothetical protein E4U41_001988 [Claviceps citrina]
MSSSLTGLPWKTQYLERTAGYTKRSPSRGDFFHACLDAPLSMSIFLPGLWASILNIANSARCGSAVPTRTASGAIPLTELPPPGAGQGPGKLPSDCGRLAGHVPTRAPAPPPAGWPLIRAPEVRGAAARQEASLHDALA